MYVSSSRAEENNLNLYQNVFLDKVVKMYRLLTQKLTQLCSQASDIQFHDGGGLSVVEF